MKFLHTADWHIGRKMADFSMIDDQKYAYSQIKKIALDNNVDAVVIAGDLYDRSVPSEEAVETLDEMILDLNIANHMPILAVSGNHDSAVRLGTGSQWFKMTQFFMHTTLQEAFTPIEMKDVQFFLLPYFELAEAKRVFEDDNIKNIDDAMKLILDKMKVKFKSDKQHVLVAHFFASGSSHTDSETKVEVGGLDAVSLDLLADFDYVALGHLHSRDALHNDSIRYSGSPLKFSVSEATNQKGCWIIDTEKHEIKWYDIQPKRDVVVLENNFDRLLTKEVRDSVGKDDFIQAVLTDEDSIPDAMNKLRICYPNIIGMKFKRSMSEDNSQSMGNLEKFKKLSPMEVLSEFFEYRTGRKLSDYQKQVAHETLKRVQEGEER